MVQRIVRALSGVLLLALNACTITIQSGPSSPTTQAYAPAPAAPRYVPVAAVAPPARLPAAPIVIRQPPPPPAMTSACPPGTIARPSTQIARPSRPAVAPAPIAGATAPRAPIASHLGGRATVIPAVTPMVSARLQARPVLASAPVTHTPTRPPVSATAPRVDSPGNALAPSAAPSPRTLAPKPGDPRVRHWL